MRTSQSVSIRPILEQAICVIDESFEREKQSLEFEKEFKSRLELGGAAPMATLDRPSREQYLRDILGPPPKKVEKAASLLYRQRAKAFMQHPPITRPKIENAYPWRHYAVQAANSLAECGWSTEAGAITKVLNELTTEPLDWQDPLVYHEQRAVIRRSAGRIREILQSCLKEMLPKFKAGSETQTHTGGRGRPGKTTPERAEEVVKWWREFKHGPIPRGYCRPKYYRKGSIDDFIAWGEFMELPNFPTSKEEVERCKKRYRDLHPKKSAKTKPPKRR